MDGNGAGGVRNQIVRTTSTVNIHRKIVSRWKARAERTSRSSGQRGRHYLHGSRVTRDLDPSRSRSRITGSANTDSALELERWSSQTIDSDKNTRTTTTIERDSGSIRSHAETTHENIVSRSSHSRQTSRGHRIPVEKP